MKPDARQLRGEATRARILQATRELLAEVGQDLTLEGIARRVGVSKQAVLHHFPSRERVIVELVVEALELERDLSIAAVQGLGGVEALRAWMLALHDFYTSDIERFRLLYLRSQMMPVAPTVFPDEEKARRMYPVTGAMYDAVEAALRRGGLGGPDLRARLVAAHFQVLGLATIHGAMAASRSSFKQPLAAYLEAALAVWTRGIP